MLAQIDKLSTQSSYKTSLVVWQWFKSPGVEASVC